MKKMLSILAMLLVAAGAAWAAPAERYLHVRVDNGRNEEKVNLNLPLPLAAQVIPAIDNGRLRNGMIQMGDFQPNGINVRQILEALKTAPDGEFLTVQQGGNKVRVAKKNGVLLVSVGHAGAGGQRVSITVPWPVAVALTSGVDKNELNIEAAIQALEQAGDMTLVSVVSDSQTVRVWVDSNSGSE